MGRIITVNGCRDCPFLLTQEGCFQSKFWCQSEQGKIPKNLRSDYEGPGDDAFPVTPDWCPLKTDSVTVSFRG
jgi:hypothetical protein